MLPDVIASSFAFVGMVTLYSNISLVSSLTAGLDMKLERTIPLESSKIVVFAIGDKTESLANPLAFGRKVNEVKTIALSDEELELPTQISVARILTLTVIGVLVLS